MSEDEIKARTFQNIEKAISSVEECIDKPLDDLQFRTRIEDGVVELAAEISRLFPDIRRYNWKKTNDVFFMCDLRDFVHYLSQQRALPPEKVEALERLLVTTSERFQRYSTLLQSLKEKDKKARTHKGTFVSDYGASLQLILGGFNLGLLVSVLVLKLVFKRST